MDAPSEITETSVKFSKDAELPWTVEVAGRVGTQTRKATGYGETTLMALQEAYKKFELDKAERAEAHDAAGTEAPPI